MIAWRGNGKIGKEPELDNECSKTILHPFVITDVLWSCKTERHSHQNNKTTNYSILFLSLFCREEIWEFFLKKFKKIVQFSFQLAKMMCPYWKNHYSIGIYIQLHTDWQLHWNQFWHFGIYWHLYRVILFTEYSNKPLTYVAGFSEDFCFEFWVAQKFIRMASERYSFSLTTFR